jgi:hypothetical protein
VIVGAGYMLEEVPIHKLPGGGRGGGNQIREFLGKISQTVQRSRERGPSFAILREKDALLNLEEPVPAKAGRLSTSKNEVTIEVAPAAEGMHHIVVKLGKRVMLEGDVEGVPAVVRPTLVTFGVTVPYDEIVISGTPEEPLLQRLREAVRESGGDAEAVRKRMREGADEQAKRNEEEARRKERERREREKQGGGEKPPEGEKPGEGDKGEGEKPGEGKRREGEKRGD